MTILFLYTELAGYFAACIKELAKHVDAIHIVRFPVNAEAPFQFNFPQNVIVYERNSFSTEQLIKLAKDISPDTIFSSGWVDKGYLKVCRHFKGKAPTVMSMDNHWFGTSRQWLMRAAAPFTIHRSYSHVWVPGKPQKEYAIKLGFRNKRIREGFYSADVPLFASEAACRTEAENYPHRFIYVGRYIPAKGLDVLFAAFTEVADETGADWELWCIGTGEEFERRTIHPQIKHLGFLQPAELKEQLCHAGVFVLPSRFEPWGVVVHEMAAAGFPMICSSAVGAASRFLETEKNGYLFTSGSKDELKMMMKTITETRDATLRQMAQQSHRLGISYTTKEWAKTALGF
jgi:glycosyltransferase involved in cell wall biosynthesis